MLPTSKVIFTFVPVAIVFCKFPFTKFEVLAPLTLPPLAIVITFDEPVVKMPDVKFNVVAETLAVSVTPAALLIVKVVTDEGKPSPVTCADEPL